MHGGGGWWRRWEDFFISREGKWEQTNAAITNVHNRHQPCIHACDIGIVPCQVALGGGDEPCWQSDIGVVSMSALSSSPGGRG